MKILICEDDTMTLKAIEHKLKTEQYETFNAKDGKAAKKILKTQNIDLLITDLHMPNMNGHELIEFVRTELKSYLPIIMLTRDGMEDSVLKAFKLGADDYITKPFKPNELSLRIKRALIRYKTK